MFINFKLYIKSILGSSNFSFIDNKGQSLKNDSLLLDPKTFYLLALHFRFSSLFYTTQLVDIFSYELPRSVGGSDHKKVNKGMSTVSVYNFHVIGSQNRFFIFSQGALDVLDKSSLLRPTNSLSSITELFSAAN